MIDKNTQAEQKAAFLEHLRNMPIIKVACKNSGVSRTSIYRWQEEDEEFSKAVDKAMVEGRLNTNDLTEIQLLSQIHDRNPSLIKYYLEHNHPGYMKKGQDDEKDMSPTVIILHDHED